MANLSSKFVTSFSELYFRPSGLTAGELANPSSWFAVTGEGSTAKVFTVTVETTTSVAGTLVMRYTNASTGRINSVAVSIGSAETVATIAGAIKTALAADADISNGTVTTGAFDATIAAAAAIATAEAVFSVYLQENRSQNKRWCN